MSDEDWDFDDASASFDSSYGELDSEDTDFKRGKNARLYLVDCHESLWNGTCEHNDSTISTLQMVIRSLISVIHDAILNTPSDKFSIVFYNTLHTNSELSLYADDAGVFVLNEPEAPSAALVSRLEQLVMPATFRSDIGLCPSLSGTPNSSFSAALSVAYKLLAAVADSGQKTIHLVTAHDQPAYMPLEAAYWAILSSSRDHSDPAAAISAAGLSEGALKRITSMCRTEARATAERMKLLEDQSISVYAAALQPQAASVTGLLRRAGIDGYELDTRGQDLIAALSDPAAAASALSLASAAGGSSSSTVGLAELRASLAPSQPQSASAAASDSSLPDDDKAKAEMNEAASLNPFGSLAGSLAAPPALLPSSAPSVPTSAASTTAQVKTEPGSAPIDIQSLYFNPERLFPPHSAFISMLTHITPDELPNLAEDLMRVARFARVYARVDVSVAQSVDDMYAACFPTTGQPAPAVTPLFAAKAYLLYSADKGPLGKKITVHKDTQRPLRSASAYVRPQAPVVAEDGSVAPPPAPAVIPRTQLANKYGYGGTECIIPDVDRKKIQSGGVAGVNILGFLPRSYVSPTMCVKTGYFLASDPESRVGSDVAMASLAEVLHKRQLCARARVVFRDFMAPRMCLLYPYVQADDAPGGITYNLPINVNTGMFVYIVPYSDDVRDHIPTWSTPVPKEGVSEEDFERGLSKMSEEIGQMMSLIEGPDESFDPAVFRNPVIEHQTAQLAALATQSAPQPAEDSLALPNTWVAHRPALSRKWAEVMSTVDEITDAAPEPKKARAPKAGSVPDTMADGSFDVAFYERHLASGTVAKLTVAVLKDYCKHFRIKLPSGAKKDDCVTAVTNHLQASRP